MTRITVLSALAVGLLGNTSSMPAATTVTTPTVAVGTCRPGFPTYTTISAAVSAATAGTKALICPGTYTEQVHLTQSLTLQGVNNGNADQAIIVPPGSGLANNATDDFGDPLAVQLWLTMPLAVQSTSAISP